MSKKPSKLSDIFNMTNAVLRPRSDGSVSRLGKALDIDGITTRFQRNKVLIDPKAFHLMTDYDTLKRYKLFAAYKPPFAPMRRSESFENHHRVSMESYLSAAMKSKDMEPIVSVLLKGEDPNAKYRSPMSSDAATTSSADSNGSVASSAPESLQIRVVNELPDVAAGPVLVHLSDSALYVHNDFTRYHYEAIVYGHVKLRDADGIGAAVNEMRSSRSGASSSPSTEFNAAGIDGTIRGGYGGTTATIGSPVDLSDLSVLYPGMTTAPPEQRLTTVPRRSLSPAMLRYAKEHYPQPAQTDANDTQSELITIPAPRRTDAPSVRVFIKSYGFYATHPATLIRFSTQSTGSAAKPDLLTFVRAATGSYAIGDPMAKRDTTNANLKTLRAGDKDFPRVFVNLRSAGINVFQRNPLWGDEVLLSSTASSPQRENDHALGQSPWLAHSKYLEFACDGSLDNLVSDSQLALRKARICLTDGLWSPTMRAGF